MLFVSQMFERETRREKILEARHREMKLKERIKSGAEKGVSVPAVWRQSRFIQICHSIKLESMTIFVKFNAEILFRSMMR